MEQADKNAKSFKGTEATVAFKGMEATDATENNCRPITDSEEEYFIDRLGSKSTRPIITDCREKPPNGAGHRSSFWIISERTHKAQFADVKLRKSCILLKTYSNERIHVLGQLHVRVTYGVQ